MSKNLDICFKKSNKNIKDYIPSCIKEINIREQNQIIFPEESNLEYSPFIIPNTPFEEFPSEEEINNYNFQSENTFNDNDNNLLIFPYSVRKETFNNIIWERPEEIIKQQQLIKLIRKELPDKNFNYIAKKINSTRKDNNNINYRYSIDFGTGKNLVNNLSEMKLDKNEKKIEKKINELEYEITIINNEKKEPSNINLKRYYCNYLKWIGSLFQVIIDNNINEKEFIKRIYPQNEEGFPIYNSSGKYWVKLFHMGKFRKIEIDDKFPCDKKTYECYFPQCENLCEIWPWILTKAIIKLFSYKYRNDYFENEENYDLSPFYALTGYFGYNIDKQVIYSLIEDNNQKYNLNNDNNDENEEKDCDDNYSEIKEYIKDLLFKNDMNSAKNSILIGYHIPKEKTEKDNSKLVKYVYSERALKIKPQFQTERNIKSPNINSIHLLEKYKNNLNNKNENNNNDNNNNESNKLLNKFKNKKISNISSYDLPDIFSTKHFNYFSPLETLKNKETIIINKTNKKLENGIYCNIAYSIIELFQSGNFNMKRLKPIPFNDLKLNFNIKFKQMNGQEKKNYLAQLKDLRLKQKAELHNRLREFRQDGQNLFLFKITNNMIDFNGKKAFQINSEFNDEHIQIAKFLIINNLKYPSVNYFKNTFLNKVWKDDETGEINFWTKNFYLRLC